MNTAVRSGLAALMLICAATVAGAQVVTVTIATDTVDIDWQNATIEDLPGPDGEISLSEAIIATNHTPGHQTIGFAIPRERWILQFLYPGCAVLDSLTGYFFNVTDELTIDGTTQTEFTGDTNPDGWEVVIYREDLWLNAPNCTLIGFHSTAIGVTGSDCLIDGNTGMMNLTVYSGARTLIRNNEAGTIKIDRANDSVIVGNTVQRIRVLGGGIQQPAANNRIGGPDPADRNFIIGYGTINSEGLPSGHAIQLAWARDTLIENNSIGTTPDGLEQGNLACTMGIGFENDNANTTIRNNRIAGILGHGQGPHHAGQLFGWAILIGGAGSNVVIEGNTIGLDASGQPTLGSVTGIDVGSYAFGSLSDVRIGGNDPGQGNAIAGHRLDGVTVGRNMPSARISGNRIYSNGTLGIDLIPTSFVRGVSQNDPLDTDTGGNGVQNFPVLTSAANENGSLHLVGGLSSSPLDEFTIEFFASPTCDGSGHGEGTIFVGTTDATTNGNGDATFDVMLPGSVEPGWVITATATLEPIGATSEFSACREVTAGVSLRLAGNCPGGIAISWDGAAPNRPMGVAFARNRGAVVIPNGPCAGTQLGLGNVQLQLAARTTTGADGSGQLNGNVATGACGGYLQLVISGDSPCTTSNIAQLP